DTILVPGLEEEQRPIEDRGEATRRGAALGPPDQEAEVVAVEIPVEVGVDKGFLVEQGPGGDHPARLTAVGAETELAAVGVGHVVGDQLGIAKEEVGADPEKLAADPEIESGSVFNESKPPLPEDHLADAVAVDEELELGHLDEGADQGG